MIPHTHENLVKNTVFWDVMPSSLPHSHIPEGLILHSHCYQNFKPHMKMWFYIWCFYRISLTCAWEAELVAPDCDRNMCGEISCLTIRYTRSQSHNHTAKVYVHRTAFELIICPVYDCYLNAVLHWLVN
jgi:hypothetical protein